MRSTRAAALVPPRWAVLCALVALIGAGCSAQTKSAVTVSGSSLTIYASQPPGVTGGPTATDVLDAEELAFRQNGSKVGNFTVKLTQLHGRELSDDARTAIQDASAIAYLGEIVPGTSQISVPITNELGVLQVSPTDTAVYLTQATPGVAGSPGTFYPSSSTYHETFARVVPNTAKEAKAIVAQMHALGLSKLDVISDGQPYGTSIASQVRQDASAQGLTVVSGASTADVVFYAGNSTAAATTALNGASTTSPSAKLFAPSALYGDVFAAGLNPAAQKNLYVSSPGFAAAALPAAGKQFVSAFKTAYGHDPVPAAIFGYEAMSAVIAVLKEAGAQAGNRATVVSDFRTLHDRQSVLGTYSITGGDTSLDSFVFGRVSGGKLVVRAGG